MAAPKEITTLDLTGQWTMNKTLSEDITEVLTLQNIGWFMRKAIQLATITLHVKHYKDDAGVEHIDIDQTLTGGVKGTTELRELDWTDRDHEDHIFGKTIGKSRRINVEEVEDEYLRTGWLPDTVETGVIDSYVVSEVNNWTAHQIWGFEEIDGVRYYVRHLKFETPKKRIDRRLVYTYIGA
ncbi:hypothetical protein RUND412_000830 [Rhizina undulata]